MTLSLSTEAEAQLSNGDIKKYGVCKLYDYFDTYLTDLDVLNISYTQSRDFGVGVANIMYVAVRERTREIGTKIALGAKKGHIIFQFMTEALAIAFLGGFLGILFSVVVCRIFWLLPMEDALELLAKPTVNWPVAIITVITLSTIGFVAGFFPARKAASVNPVEALRYE